MIKRIDIVERELRLYPQYYQDKYFGENPNGRFVRWSDIPVHIQKMLMEE